MDLLKPPGGAGPAILIAHPWWGLNQTIRDYRAALAAQGFVVGLPDLFDGQIATTPGAAENLARSNWEQAGPKLATALRELADLNGGPVGAIGFSFGAFHLLRLLDTAAPIRALAIYYATLLPPIPHVPIMAHLAELDSEESPADMQALSAALAAAGPPNAAFTYAGMKHWFAESDRPEYDAAIAKLAFERTVVFLRN